MHYMTAIDTITAALFAYSASAFWCITMITRHAKKKKLFRFIPFKIITDFQKLTVYNLDSGIFDFNKVLVLLHIIFNYNRDCGFCRFTINVFQFIHKHHLQTADLHILCYCQKHAKGAMILHTDMQSKKKKLIILFVILVRISAFWAGFICGNPDIRTTIRIKYRLHFCITFRTFHHIHLQTKRKAQRHRCIDSNQLLIAYQCGAFP